jgi:hypothetical protein
VFGSIEQDGVSSRDLDRVLGMAAEDHKEEMTRNELECEKKTSCVI